MSYLAEWPRISFCRKNRLICEILLFLNPVVNFSQRSFMITIQGQYCHHLYPLFMCRLTFVSVIHACPFLPPYFFSLFFSEHYISLIGFAHFVLIHCNYRHTVTWVSSANHYFLFFFEEKIILVLGEIRLVSFFCLHLTMIDFDSLFPAFTPVCLVRLEFSSTPFDRCWKFFAFYLGRQVLLWPFKRPTDYLTRSKVCDHVPECSLPNSNGDKEWMLNTSCVAQLSATCRCFPLLRQLTVRALFFFVWALDVLFLNFSSLFLISFDLLQSMQLLWKSFIDRTLCSGGYGSYFAAYLFCGFDSKVHFETFFAFLLFCSSFLDVRFILYHFN